jgi:hypothetical protein
VDFNSSGDSIGAGVAVIRGAGRRNLAFDSTGVGKDCGGAVTSLDRVKNINPITINPAANNAMTLRFIFVQIGQVCARVVLKFYRDESRT